MSSWTRRYILVIIVEIVIVISMIVFTNTFTP